MPIWLRLGPAFAALALSCVAIGCGGGSGSGSNPVNPISVSLEPSTVVVSQDGMPTHVQISIKSTSETALVSFTGLPGGVQESYAASDTNPSGTLTFVASTSVQAGTYSPTVVVNSAGQMASLKFTMVVEAAVTSNQ